MASSRILVVGERWPWPQDHGAAMRLANVVEALAAVGDVDLFAIVNRPEEVGETPLHVSRAGFAVRPALALTPARRLSWLATGRLPLEYSGRDYSPVRRQFTQWEAGPYDLVWFADSEAWIALSPLVAAPSYVDFDDLEDQAAWLKGQSGGWPGDRRRLVQPIAAAERRLRRRKNARQWRRFRAGAARAGSVLVMSSEADRRRCTVTPSVIVSNGYDPPEHPLGRVALGHPPTVLLAGNMQYGPNLDAARRLVRDIGPRLRAMVPDAQLRLVGLGDVRSRSLDDPPSVVVTGRVPDMASELMRADMVAVPLHHGGGTRIKILEAFAHRIPVVSTTVGAYGLDVRDGQHLLVRDDPMAFADACASVLQDQSLRATLTAAATEFFHGHHRWDRIRRDLGHDASSRLRGKASGARSIQ